MKKILLALALCAATSTCNAQPAPDEGKAQNPDAAKAMLDKAMADGRQAAEKIMAMTPAQRRAYMDQLAEQQLRALLTGNGFNDMELQEEIVLFAREQSASRQKIREAGARLRDAITDKASTPQTLATLLNTYDAAVENERARRDKAEAELRQKLNLDANPRLDGTLRLYGVVGDSAWLMGNNIMAGLSASAMLPEPGELPKQ